MPAKSQAQFRLMKAIEHNPKVAKKVGMSSAKAAEFTESNKGKKAYSKLPVKKAYGGSMDDDGYSRAGTSRNRLARDARDYDSDIDYYNDVNGRDDDDDQQQTPSPKKRLFDRIGKQYVAANKKIQKQKNEAKEAKDEDALKRLKDREERIGIGYVTRIAPISHANNSQMLEKRRKEWSEKIGNGKPAPFKSGGSSKKTCW
jgi:hypothetical protein